MKDFNKLILNGEVLDEKQLVDRSKNNSELPSWERDFWQFISAWLDPTPYIEVQTSGSTGKPKTLQIDKTKMLTSAQLTCSYFNLQARQSVLLCMSPKHIGGMMMIVRALFAKLNLHIVKPQANPLQDIDIPIDFVAMVPYQIQTCMSEDPEKLASIGNVLIGGGMLTSKLEVKIVAAKVNAYHSFGMTETVSHFALRRPGREKYFSCLPGITIQQAENDTLQVFAPMFEAAPIQTNDIIEKLSDQTFEWKGRLDFAIETGGIKVLPELIEAALEKHIDQRFFISSLPDEKLNNRVILIIEGDKKELPSNLFDELPNYHQPKAVYFLEKFIETASGKVDRLASREKVLF